MMSLFGRKEKALLKAIHNYNIDIIKDLRVGGTHEVTAIMNCLMAETLHYRIGELEGINMVIRRIFTGSYKGKEKKL